MRKRLLSRIALLAAMILLLLACAPAVLAESAPKLNTYQKALSWVKKNHPAELDLGSVRFFLGRSGAAQALSRRPRSLRGPAARCPAGPPRQL